MPELSASPHRWLTVALFATIALFASACAPTLQKDGLAEVKKVAVIGYSVTTSGEASATNIFEVVDNAQEADEGSPQAVDGYRMLTELLGNELGWEVIGYEDVAGDATYKALFEDNHSEFFTGLSSLTGGMHPPGILWGPWARQLGRAERQRLMESLGVDAIVIASIDMHVRSGFTSSIGLGAETYEATLNFEVFDRKRDDPIWSDQNADGESDDGSLTFEIAGVKLRDEVTPLFFEAIENAYINLIHRYDDEGGVRPGR